MKKPILFFWFLLNTLSLPGLAAAACPTQTISVGQTINGTLDNLDCYVNVSGDQYYTDYYQFSGVAGQQIYILQTSGNFDSWLTVYAPDGSHLDDNNGGGGVNARIPAGTGYMTLPLTGAYSIEASSNISLQTGAYTLTLGSPNTSPSNPPGSTVLEFYNTNLKHYFMTADSLEAIGIDNGAAGPGWLRTGESFGAWKNQGEAAPGAKSVCRFYGTPGQGPNSHFYTADASECNFVKNDPGWFYEGIAYYIGSPSSGACPAGYNPVYRAYNNRWMYNDSNHRFTTSFLSYQQMFDEGWATEGIVMCSPAGSAITITSLDKNSASPYGLVKIGGNGFDTSANLSVRFYNDADGFSVAIPVVAASATSVIVSVPPYVSKTGALSSGNASIQVIQGSATTTATSNALNGFTIQALPIPPSASGTTTLYFLKAAIAQANKLKDLISGTSMGTTNILSSLSSLSASLDSIVSGIQSVMQGLATSFTLGSINGVPIIIDASQLQETDRMINGMVTSMATPTQSTPDAGTTAGAISYPGDLNHPECMQQEASTLSQTLASPTPDFNAFTAFFNSPVSSSNCRKITSLNMAYMAIGGASGEGLANTVLTGASATALTTHSSPSAALLYSSAAGGGGMIGVGGAAGQTTSPAEDFAKEGYYKIESFKNGFLGAALPNSTGKLAGIMQGSNALNQALNPTPPATTSFTLSIIYAGTGSGTVNANPPGYSYPPNTGVTLTPVPNANSVFQKWVGDCALTLVYTENCYLNMDGNKTVTVYFDLKYNQPLGLN